MNTRSVARVAKKKENTGGQGVICCEQCIAGSEAEVINAASSATAGGSGLNLGGRTKAFSLAWLITSLQVFRLTLLSY